jgi:hypothetical protein
MGWLLANMQWIVAFAGVWTLGNGILHDVFVLAERRPFDHELIRLLIDGHIMIFGGVVYLICFQSLNAFNMTAWWVCVANAVFLIGYCMLIFKLLPAVGMMFVNALVLLVLMLMYYTF